MMFPALTTVYTNYNNCSTPGSVELGYNWQREKKIRKKCHNTILSPYHSRGFTIEQLVKMNSNDIAETLHIDEVARLIGAAVKKYVEEN